MDEIRRDEDGELCGYVAPSIDGWDALTVFGGLLGSHQERSEAELHVVQAGLSSLAERWTLRNGASGEEEIVCIQEANPVSVTVVRDYYPVPGVPTLTISTQQLRDGEWHLSR